ncbi:2-hydroxyacid dehydrogenase [Arthrobacter crystallopoietes]|uniref:Phosphoglycerate dehydrogenase n=1 Tax=Crystallibacter crystallopoietes TaxID=37928 RepID=A0A1H0ZKN6_9MICC|nr:2-hydroxyacid dehydrogenase [Arthrobacter crystallopoietes]AUI51933.1 hydroxyacid dehydrogenase [Arthrobacter crystallopoietes]SDQ27907.1 Phosphoglycerate dehydrogenase [Arthrobacter crystallopoietes]
MSSTAGPIKTITFPDRELLEAVQPLPDGIRATVWDFRDDPVDVDLAEVDAVVLPYLNAQTVLGSLSRAGNLKFVQAQTTGIDGVREAVGANVTVASAAGVHAASTAELAVGLVLASLRGIDKAAQDQLEGRWRHERRLSLADRRVLLVGVGGIGAEISKRLIPFDVELTRVGSQARDDNEGHVHSKDELIQLAANTDVLIVITPLTEGTRGLIGREVLAALPDGALLVNVARGGVVDSEALTAEVVSGRISCAIDVFDPEPIPATHPLWQAENALITPHVGGDTSAFFPRIVHLLKRQLDALGTGSEPENLVQQGTDLS